ncbi:acidobacterial duplicated orphan permease [Luteitalea pratensis]|uniref:Acidobacterial duplicated orphan permease n=1 Tax=Luteitalea pratensis TaxID=1855912 RepID=A0A143PI62_LUTPR|nr:hypothetical protein [Luteitalea pratensis]AMY08181.1 acidobacterial duplicated orphan permease [Luteitalea pratensis]
MQFYERMVEEVTSLPEVQDTDVITDLFVSSDAEVAVLFDTGSGVGSDRVRLRLDEASGSALSTVQVPVLRGRSFTAADTSSSPPVALINSALARLWNGETPLGRRLKLADLCDTRREPPLP